MMKIKKDVNKILTIAFVLIGMLILFNILSYTGMVTLGEEEQWACSQYVCDKVITAEEWINDNCYTMPDGSNQVVCKVIIEDKEQLVPLDMINQETLNKCIEARCVQEARVRPADYKVDLQQPQE